MSKFLFVSDLDHTFVGDDAALIELQKHLSHHRTNYGTKIVYATGRSPVLYRQLKAEKSLIDPDALVTSVGTEIYPHDASDTPDKEWSEILSHGWNREIIVSTLDQFSQLAPQPDSEQRPFKVSYYLSETAATSVVPQIESALAEQGLSVKLVYSGGQDLDVLPIKGNKGLAMQFLARRWGFSSDRTVACGDSGNDIALFSVGDERGIIVGNARPELVAWHQSQSSNHVYRAKAHYAAGILEGLKYFGFI